MDKWDAIANLTIFLVKKTGSSFGCFVGRMTAKEQRELFGTYLGRGSIIIDGKNELLQHVIKVAFGQDYSETFNKEWRDL